MITLSEVLSAIDARAKIDITFEHARAEGVSNLLSKALKNNGLQVCFIDDAYAQEALDLLNSVIDQYDLIELKERVFDANQVMEYKLIEALDVSDNVRDRLMNEWSILQDSYNHNNYIHGYDVYSGEAIFNSMGEPC